METLVKDIWRDKPLLITVMVAIAGLLYILWKNSQGASQTPVNTPTSTPSTSIPSGTFVEYSYYNNTPTSVSNTYTGNPAQTPVVAPPVTTPVATSVPKAPPTLPGANRTITVTGWPTQNSTLWGIAITAYNNGSLWPKIYAANKSKIGSNPNFLTPGTVLTIP